MSKGRTNADITKKKHGISKEKNWFGKNKNETMATQTEERRGLSTPDSSSIFPLSQSTGKSRDFSIRNRKTHERKIRPEIPRPARMSEWITNKDNKNDSIRVERDSFIALHTTTCYIRFTATE